MSRLDDLIAKLCPDGVEYVQLGEIISEVRERNKDCKYNQVRSVTNSARLIPTSEYFDRIVTSADTSNYKVVREGMFVYNPARINIGSIAWLVECEPVIVSPMYVVFSINTNRLSQQYFQYYIQSGAGVYQINSKVESGARFRLPIESFDKVIIPLPPLPVQQEIVRILDKFTALEADLEADLEARKKQYEYYRNSLLTFSDDMKQFTIGEVFDMKAGKSIYASEISSIKCKESAFPCYGGNGLRGYVKEPSHYGKSIIIGRQGALCGNVKRVDGEFYATEHAVVVTAKPGIDIDWAFHILSAMNLNQYATKSAQPGLSVRKIETLTISIPPLAEQERIAAILDHFDTLVNDITQGLPAEIAARRKQYEYYRDTLLTF